MSTVGETKNIFPIVCAMLTRFSTEIEVVNRYERKHPTMIEEKYAFACSVAVCVSKRRQFFALFHMMPRGRLESHKFFTFVCVHTVCTIQWKR